MDVATTVAASTMMMDDQTCSSIAASMRPSTLSRLIFDLFVFLAGIVFAMASAALLYFFYFLSTRRYTEMRAAADVSSLGVENLRKAFARFHGGLPAALLRPDMDRATFVNDALKNLWPYIDRAAVSWAFENQNLENLLNSQTFWKPSWLAASGVILQSLLLGQAPPKVTGIKIYPPDADSSADALIADVSFDWASKMMVQLAMKTLTDDNMSFLDRALGLVYRGIGVKVVVRNLVARGQMRIVAGPLLSRLPVVGAVRVSFLEPPATSYQVSSFGANPLMIPGLEAWLNSFISETVLDPFTFPAGFSLDISELLGMGAASSAPRPEGLLTVDIEKATGVPRTDLFGSCDPYIRLYVNPKMKNRTAVKPNTLNPVWEDEEFEFVVHSKDHQRLTLELWDSDALRADELIGTVDVALSGLDLRTNHPNHLVLGVPRIGKNGNKKKAQGSGGSDGATQVVVSRVASSTTLPVGDAPAGAGAAGVSTASARHQTATSTPAASVSRVGGTTGAAPSTWRGAAPKSSGTELHINVTYYPFNKAQVKAAMDARAGLRPSLSIMPSSVSRKLRGGMLYVKVLRGDLPTTKRAVTKTFRLVIEILDGDGEVRYHKTWERSGLGKGLSSTHPVFDCEVDFLLDGDVAHSGDTVVSVSVFVSHLIRKDTFKGQAKVPLAKVLADGKIHDDNVPMEGSTLGGKLEMAMEWLGIVDSL